jgi:hypothetical protein
MRGILAVSESVHLIGIRSDQYSRWRSEIYGCGVSKRKCDSTWPNQLTRYEKKKLVE